jgi:hypothetical protein
LFARSGDQYHLCAADAPADKGSAAATIIAAMTVIDQSFGVMPKARREESRAPCFDTKPIPGRAKEPFGLVTALLSDGSS